MGDPVWQSMDTAPRDGTPFLSCDPRFRVVSLTVRRVRFIADEALGTISTVDMGAWLYIDGIDNDWADHDTNGEPSWSVAPDQYNKNVQRIWTPLPAPPASDPIGSVRKALRRREIAEIDKAVAVMEGLFEKARKP